MSRIINLPTGWKRKRLEKVAIIQTGIAKNQNSKEECIELPYLRVANVQDGYLDLSEIKIINIHKDKVNRYRLENGDVLLTEGGDFDKLGRGAVWEGQIQNCLHQNHVFAVRPNNHELLSSFLSAQTGSSYGKKYFLSCSKQSTNLASINSSQLKAFPVLLPPLSEQKAIATLLSTWDEAIDKTERLIQAKEKRFKWLLRELISEPRNTQKDAKWKRVNIGAFLTESRISGTNGRDAQKITVKLYGKGVIAKNEKRIGSETTQYYVRKSGQFIYSKLDFLNGAFGIIPEELDGFESTLDLPAFDIADSVSKEWFLYYLIRPGYYTRQLGLAKGQRKARRVNPSEFLNSKIPFPPLEVQKQIAETLSSAQHEIDLLKQLSEKYKTQKRGLMQKMLTGEWRVKPEIVNQYMEA